MTASVRSVSNRIPPTWRVLRRTMSMLRPGKRATTTDLTCMLDPSRMDEEDKGRRDFVAIRTTIQHDGLRCSNCQNAAPANTPPLVQLQAAQCPWRAKIPSTGFGMNPSQRKVYEVLHRQPSVDPNNTASSEHDITAIVSATATQWEKIDKWKSVRSHRERPLCATWTSARKGGNGRVIPNSRSAIAAPNRPPRPREGSSCISAGRTDRV